jgi:hypothetical protein
VADGPCLRGLHQRELDRVVRSEFGSLRNVLDREGLKADFLSDPGRAIEKSIWLTSSLLKCDQTEALKRVAADTRKLLGVLALGIAGHAHALSVTLSKSNEKVEKMMSYDRNGWVDARILAAGIRSNFFVTEDKRLLQTAQFVARALVLESKFKALSLNELCDVSYDLIEG